MDYGAEEGFGPLRDRALGQSHSAKAIEGYLRAVDPRGRYLDDVRVAARLEVHDVGLRRLEVHDVVLWRRWNLRLGSVWMDPRDLVAIGEQHTGELQRL